MLPGGINAPGKQRPRLKNEIDGENIEVGTLETAIAGILVVIDKNARIPAPDELAQLALGPDDAVAARIVVHHVVAEHETHARLVVGIDVLAHPTVVPLGQEAPGKEIHRITGAVNLRIERGRRHVLHRPTIVLTAGKTVHRHGGVVILGKS